MIAPATKVQQRAAQVVYRLRHIPEVLLRHSDVDITLIYSQALNRWRPGFAALSLKQCRHPSTAIRARPSAEPPLFGGSGIDRFWPVPAGWV